jgi:23S rRNA pseudouridine2604 synthase
MCEYLGYDVKKLKRVRIMNIPLDIAIGKWRYISEKELQEINQLLKSSSKTHNNKN